MKHKRLTALVLTAALVLAGCGGTKSSSGSGAVSASGVETGRALSVLTGGPAMLPSSRVIWEDAAPQPASSAASKTAGIQRNALCFMVVLLCSQWSYRGQ